MLPSSTWFPTNLQDQAAWFQNFEDNFSVVGASLGFTALEIGSVEDDNNCFQGIASGAVALKAYVAAVRTYRKFVTQGNIGEPTPTFPASPVIVPAELAPTGIFQRLDRTVGRVRLAPNYTPEIGALLGIIPASPSRPAPEDLQPVIKVTPLAGSVVSVKWSRQSMTGIAIETQVDNSGTWTNVGQFTTSPAELDIPQNPQNLPRAVQVRARYLDKDEPVGLLSQVDTVSTLPAA